ncbi:MULTISPECIES: hypothetical protein [Bacillales]|uniref:hypothetical protein n=1 Tax=Bacillales TaxID=1385 RepID=UPI00187C6DBA|nr:MULTISPECIES: hypothetical protein [Bacillales]
MEHEVNSTMEAAAKQFSNVTLADWYTASTDKNSYFTRDGVHLAEEGAKVYASLVVEVIKPQQSANGGSHTAVYGR